MSQCRRMHRAERGKPWVQCTQVAVAVLWSGTRKCGPYCLECCNYFTATFPVRTFIMEFLPDEETSDATG